MIYQLMLVCLLWIGVRSEPPSNSYGTPLGNPINNYDGDINSGHNGHNGHNGHEHEPGQAYEFGYEVRDEYSGNNYNRKESSDGNQVKGEYSVLLPDGRTQIVTYYADWQTGFHAIVRYEGTPNNLDSNVPNGGYDLNRPAINPYNQNQNGYDARSSVLIKDYANNQNDFSNFGGNQNNLDSYSRGNFGGKPRPSNEYGAP